MLWSVEDVKDDSPWWDREGLQWTCKHGSFGSVGRHSVLRTCLKVPKVHPAPYGVLEHCELPRCSEAPSQVS